jgi:hypothetical protein
VRDDFVSTYDRIVAGFCKHTFGREERTRAQRITRLPRGY